MKKFKYELGITGTPEQLQSLFRPLQSLGYRKFAITDDWSIKNVLVTRNLGDWQFTNLSDESRQFTESVRVSASNPELVLALAAAVDSDEFYEGEYVVTTHTDDDYYLPGELHKVIGINATSFETRLRTLAPTPREGGGDIKNGWGEHNFRKATKEEILNHFNMKKIIGYKLKEDCKQFGLAAKSITGLGLDLDPITVRPPSAGCDGTLCYRKLKEAGVLDLWFEPIYEEQKKTLNIRCNDGGFDIEVSKDGIFYAPDNAFLDVTQLRELCKSTEVRTKKGNASSQYSFKATHLDSGCKKGVPVEDWIKVLNAYDEIKGK